MIARALASDPALTADSLPDGIVAREHLWKFSDAVQFLHAPPPRLSLPYAAGARRAHASGVDAPQVRRAPRAAALAEGAPEGAGGAARAGADRHGRADGRIAGARAVQAYPRAGARLARDQPRPEAHDADAAPAAGRRRQRQDDHRGARRAAGDRVGPAGRVHGADRNPRRAALSQARALARRLAGRDRVAVPAGCRRRRARRRSRRSRAATRCSRSARTRCSRRGAAAALGLAIVDEQHRFGVAQRLEAARQGDGRSAPADDERDADPAHARDDVLRGSRCLGHRRDAARAHAGRDPAREQQAPRRSDRARAPRVRRGPAGLLGVPADRGVREARAADGGRVARGADSDAARIHGRVCCMAG